MRQYEIATLPTLVLLNSDGKVLGKVEGYSNEGPAEVITWIEKVSTKTK
jgi:thioredoxin-related protein